MPVNSKEVVKQVRVKMEKSLDVTKKEFQNLRTGRASTSLIEGIMVEYYGTPTLLKQMAAISTPLNDISWRSRYGGLSSTGP